MCEICKDTKFRATQPSPGQIVFEPCPCSKPKPKSQNSSWYLNMAFKQPDGSNIDRRLMSIEINEHGKHIVLHEQLSSDEIGVIVDSTFQGGLMTQALVLALSEIKHLQNRIANLEDLLSRDNKEDE